MFNLSWIWQKIKPYYNKNKIDICICLITLRTYNIIMIELGIRDFIQFLFVQRHEPKPIVSISLIHFNEIFKIFHPLNKLYKFIEYLRKFFFFNDIFWIHSSNLLIFISYFIEMWFQNFKNWFNLYYLTRSEVFKRGALLKLIYYLLIWFKYFFHI